MQTLRCRKYRYSVVFEIPSCSAIFLTGMLPFLYNASAIFAFSIAAGDIPLGRPPFLPRARADFNPACVRSRINSRWGSFQEGTKFLSTPLQPFASLGCSQ